MASRGCAGKLHHGKLHSAEYVKNYVRVTVMTSRGVNDCRARSVVAVAAAADPRRRLRMSSTAGPHCTLNLSVYLPLIFTIFPPSSSGSSSTRNILFIYLLLLYYILYFILTKNANALCNKSDLSCACNAIPQR